ncbi:MAG TPA: EscU/YscU/HrcU family type III secretion system export apparatus switch protein [Nocardioides sp.]|nr:EscU/YscU/HrcU family type III secretion system export apparatus switch protein [Nocardioides sp.]
MSGGGSGEKTEKPTAKRKKQARKDGQVARTPELGAWLSMLVVAMAMGPLFRLEAGHVRTMLVTHLTAVSNPSTSLAFTLLRADALHLVLVLAAFGSLVLGVSLLATIAQGGFYLSPKLAKPNPNKLNPFAGAKRIFGPHAWWEGVKMLAKTSVVALIAYQTVRGMLPLIGGLVPIEAVISITASRITHLLLTVTVAGLVMAAADYAMQRRRIGKQLKMSHHEIKQEHRQSEGDPLVKSAIRSRQLAAARSRMLADVADADVLLVNPTHFAVALRYQPERGAPRVVARGAGAIAARIRERALEERVPMVHDIPLTRALYRSTEVGMEIPRELWAAVAQVLAFVLSRRAAGQHGGEHRTPRAAAELPEVLSAARRKRQAPRRT